jgi:hypothetical protein
MLQEQTFEAYLISKKIDSAAFRTAEPGVWMAWKNDFEQCHPNSFTVQKLNLINPIRRKYLLQGEPAKPEVLPNVETFSPAITKPGKPVMKPRPKMT